MLCVLKRQITWTDIEVRGLMGITSFDVQNTIHTGQMGFLEDFQFVLDGVGIIRLLAELGQCEL